MEDRQQVGIVATVRRAAVGRVPVDLQTLQEAAEVLVLAAKAAQVVQGAMEELATRTAPMAVTAAMGAMAAMGPPRLGQA